MPGLPGPPFPSGLPRWPDWPRAPKRTAGTGPTSAFREFDRKDYDPDSGGRFDPTPECPYPYCYAAFDDLTAICEVLLRDVSFTGPTRFLMRRYVKDLQLMILETRRPLWLVSLLDAADLAAAGQDSWLIHAESTESYKLTREWAHWLRESETPDGGRPASSGGPSESPAGVPCSCSATGAPMRSSTPRSASGRSTPGRACNG